LTALPANSTSRLKNSKKKTIDRAFPLRSPAPRVVAHARQTGVSGRKAIFEALIVDDEVRVAIQEQAPAVQLRQILEAKGETSLFEKAVQEAAADTISLEEACKLREVTAVG
jgi:type II secretory ATPase GspE/PulE/Tfp pilus assembly ATPase PilB-like protein